MKKTDGPILPGSTIGILGQGQLGKMLAMKAFQLGYKVIVFGDTREGVAYDCCSQKIWAPYNHITSMEKFTSEADVALIEFENIPLSTIEHLERDMRVCPGFNVLKVAQNRWLEKELCHRLGIQTANTYDLEGDAGGMSLEEALEHLKNAKPGRIKLKKLGYDGHGQGSVTTEEDFKKHYAAISKNGKVPCIYEEEVLFKCELSVIVARNEAGQMVSLPAVENEHENGILRRTTYPGPNISTETNQRATEIARKIAKELQVVGLLAVEMFLLENGTILVNELAPRPHNSGHWSMDACDISQYEMYLRAACNLPMIIPTPHSKAVMANLLGDEILQPDLLSKVNSPSHIERYVHIYGKSEVKPGRKMGHVTCLEELHFNPYIKL